jgi:leader peptidase (prepilin peptidase)/N-methyltransferase
MEMQYFLWGGLVLGLLFGSFLNVCIVRVPRGESIVSPGSRCVTCGHAVRWYDNIPLLSWLVLRGKCRDCGVGIGWRYCAVELAVGLWGFVAGSQLWHAWWVSGFARILTRSFDSGMPLTFGVVGFAILGWLLIGLIVIDWEWQRLPDAFTLGGIATGMFLVCCQAIFLGPDEDRVVLNTAHQLRLSSPGSFASRGNVFLTGPEALIFGRLAAVCGAALILLLIRWVYRAFRKRDGLGLGDVKMLAMVAAFLGFWPAVLTLLVGAFLASVYSVWLLARGRAGALTKLPLGSFLGIAGLGVALFGDGIIRWYSGLF